MARKTIEQRLAELDAQRSALKARLSKQERANDTRRKVLLGALVLHRLENSNDPDFTNRLTAWLRKELPGFLTRDGDKELFADLLGKPKAAQSTGNNGEAAS
ncbi:mobilization protein [Agrobacterium pusense]|uniref:Mobilization protein n=1 Tax=Agrobacterium pusense TaxID=648995 RepID=A0AA44IXZ4_9HYPH|nr:mobilization protein [Agrobacterium pusense]NRF07313.1 mobilization protein [Agrobacterium pusense]NRF18101.1 mobilization protein [Agrobacterium pusense]